MSLPSFAQQRLWFLDALNPTSNAYNVANIVRIRGTLDTDNLRLAIAEITRRHAPLRSRFSVREGQPVVDYDDDSCTQVPFEILHGDTKDQNIEIAHARALQLAKMNISLNGSSLASWQLLQIAPDENWLLCVVHHAVWDRWSLGVFVKELNVLLHGRTLQPLQAQYQEYANNQREEIQLGAGEDALKFFEKLLGRGPYELDLPILGTRPARRKEAGQIWKFDLSHHMPLLREVGKQSRASTYLITLTAFQVWLAHTSGDWAPILATYTAGRNEKTHAELIGLFVNTLALRFDLAGNPSFLEAISVTKDTWRAAQPYTNSPFELLVDRLAPERDLSKTPIAQVAFNFHNSAPLSIQGESLQFSILEVDQKIARYDLTLTLRPDSQKLFAEFEYDTDLFDERIVRRFADHFDFLLKSALTNPEDNVRSLSLAPDIHKERIIREKTSVLRSRSPSLYQRLVEHADKIPSKVAVSFSGAELNYAQLLEQIDLVVTHFVTAGIQRGQVVGLSVARSDRMLISMLALLRLGAAYVPLDPSHPALRLNFIVDDARLDALVSDSFELSLAQEVIQIAQIPDRVGENQFVEQETYNADDAAYMIYTSGSTGKPKGVRVSHGNLTALWSALDSRISVPDSFRLLATTTISFDIAALELFWPLWRGAEVIVANENTARDGRLLAKALEHADVYQGTPASMRMLVDSGFVPRPNQILLCGGEALFPELAASLTQDGAVLHNMYGPTETTVWSSSWLVPAQSDAIYLGKVLENEWFYIMDSSGRPVPPGVTGELWVGGAGVALGYHNRVELNASRFVQDPFQAEERCYITGDLVRLDSEEHLRFIGRIDNQIKLRGHRIELGEIETVLSQISGIELAVVKVFGGTEDGRLVAFYSATDVANVPTLENIKRHVDFHLTKVMQPTNYVCLDEFPLSPSGKINRTALAEPESSLAPGNDDLNSDVELRIGQTWKKLLEIDKLTSRDDFFALGGNSLLAARMLYDLEIEFDVEVSLARFIQGSSIRELAESIASSTHLQKSSSVQLSEGQGSPIWMLRGIHIYQAFGNALPSSVGCHGVYLDEEISGLLDRKATEANIEGVAEKYVRIIKDIQPTGAYRLGGFSFGGVLAFEVAQLLRREGDVVDLVVLLDTHLPSENPGWLRRQFKRLNQIGIKRLPNVAAASISRFISESRAFKEEQTNVENSLMKTRRKIYETAIKNYRPLAYDAPVLLLRSNQSENLKNFAGYSASAWTAYCSDLATVDIETTHLGLMQEPAVFEIGAKIEEILSKDVQFD